MSWTYERIDPPDEEEEIEEYEEQEEIEDREIDPDEQIDKYYEKLEAKIWN